MKVNRFQPYVLCLVLVSIACLALGGPAVRQFDGSLHGGRVDFDGGANLLVHSVFINGKSVAAVGAYHSCPALFPVGASYVPHVGGPIISGSTKVFVGGIPVAMDGSIALCEGAGLTDTILGGSPNVFINK